MEFTTDQKKVITARNHNVLVSAAAGSGKTAVLVERILGLITDREKPVDIDRLLVVTFTNAAAAEMRERIHRTILKRLEENPDDELLKRQSVLINHAMITTIDSFCHYILMNHFQDISLDPGFSVLDPGKMKWMQKKAMEKTMEKAYMEKEPEFINLTNAFSVKGRDFPIEDMVYQIFSFVMSKPYPEKWLKETMEDYEIADVDDFCQTGFMQALLSEAHSEIRGYIGNYDQILFLCTEGEGPEVYGEVLNSERETLNRILSCTGYDAMFRELQNMEFKRLPAAKKDSCDEQVKARVQAIRSLVKDRIKKMKEQFFYEPAAALFEDMTYAGALLRPLLKLTLSFMEQFAADKRRENVIDFSDMEHFALQILVDADGGPTQTALWYQKHFEAVMIDEYQDSNDVQELLLSTISREYDASPNRFMVGDMKQSIYRFRMARPEIFMEKYNRYGKEVENTCERIELKQNFRSRSSVLKLVNDVFYPLMHPDVGGIIYDDAAALYPGADYTEDESGDYTPELLLYEKKDENGETTELSSSEGEAYLIAHRIKQLMRETKVTNKATGQLRDMRYDDIVILTRSIGSLENKLEEVLKKEGIPVTIPSKTGYFSALEIRILLQYMEVCVNPFRDIPLAAVLKSPLFGFTDDELSEIALISSDDGTKLSYYEKLKLYENGKATAFLEELDEMRLLSKTESVHDFLYQLLRRHRYLEYVSALPAGGSRRETVEMLLSQAKTYEQSRMHGLFGFLQYMKQLEKYEIDYGSGSEECINTVRIMTIHKSKGLEFPVCFVSGLAKRFNRRDINGSLLLHTDLGIGLEYRNYHEKFRRTTIKQQWIARQQLVDSMGEELRVLYVALTRAKEKCILTGTVSDYQDTFEKCEQIVGNEMVDGQLILESTSYLKLLFYVMAVKKDEKLFDVFVVHEDELMLNRADETIRERLKKDAFLQMIQAVSDDRSAALMEKTAYEYPHKELEGLYNKTSVSELKHAALHEDEQTEVIFDTEQEKQVIPEFMKEETKVAGSTRGSAYHRFMELLDFAELAAEYRNDDACEKEKDYTHRDYTDIFTEKLKYNLIKQKKRILSEKLMPESDLKLLDERKIIAFFESLLAKKMMEADGKHLLFKEQPFVMEIPAKRVNEKFPEEETMLIQGIIDAYYEEDGRIYLMDYKTDRVSEKEELVRRYKLQLDYYKEALERITGKEVAGVYIYSFHFSEVVELI